MGTEYYKSNFADSLQVSKRMLDEWMLLVSLGKPRYIALQNHLRATRVMGLIEPFLKHTRIDILKLKLRRNFEEILNYL